MPHHVTTPQLGTAATATGGRAGEAFRLHFKEAAPPGTARRAVGGGRRTKGVRGNASGWAALPAKCVPRSSARLPVPTRSPDPSSDQRPGAGGGAPSLRGCIPQRGGASTQEQEQRPPKVPACRLVPSALASAGPGPSAISGAPGWMRGHALSQRSVPLPPCTPKCIQPSPAARPAFPALSASSGPACVHPAAPPPPTLADPPWPPRWREAEDAAAGGRTP